MKTLQMLIIIAFFYGCSNTEQKDVKLSNETNPKNIQLNQTNPTKSKYDFKIESSCGFDRVMIDEKVYAFNSDIEADNALEKIMKLTGLPANFEIKAASVANACAVIKCDEEGNCDRYILYNQEFMERVKDETSTSYSELAILAHEIAHHLSGHTLSNTGSGYDMELEADKFAGFMLYKLKASIDEAKKSYSTLSEYGSSTHPPKSARIAALVNGWYEAKRNTDNNIAQGNSENRNSNNSNRSSNTQTLKAKKPKKSDTWAIYHEGCATNGKFHVSKGMETASCTGCKREYYLRWTGGTDIMTGKPSVIVYFETDRTFDLQLDNYYQY